MISMIVMFLTIVAMALNPATSVMAITGTLIPLQVPGISGVTAVSANPRGNHSLTLKSDGTVWADCQEVCGELPTEDQDPFFCLLKDDKLITELRIVTDRLLTPVSTDERIHDVYLVIHVKTISFGSVLTI
jgi:hypothetical protein